VREFIRLRSLITRVPRPEKRNSSMSARAKKAIGKDREQDGPGKQEKKHKILATEIDDAPKGAKSKCADDELERDRKIELLES